MNSSAALAQPRRRSGVTERPQRYLNASDLGQPAGFPGTTAFSTPFMVEGFLDATLQAADLVAGDAYQYIELAQVTGSENDGLAGGTPVVQVIAAAGWMLAGLWAPATWSFARVRPVARLIRLRFRHTQPLANDDWQLDLRLFLRGAPMFSRIKVQA